MPDLTGPRSGRNCPPDRRLIPGSDRAFVVRLPRSKAAPAALRGMIDAIAPPCQATEVVRLLCTEVVTNALIHAPTDAGGQIAVTARLRPPLMRIEATGEGEFRQDYGDDRPTGGYGLALVEALSESWGIDRLDSGVTVWFTVDGFPAEASTSTAIRRVRW